MSDVQKALVEAQQAIAKKDYGAAVKAFTKLIDGGKVPNPAVPLLSRSTCYMQLKKYPEAIKDAEAAFRQEDIHSSEELLPGCYTSRTASAARLASAYEAMGDKEKSATYKKLATELLKKGAKNVDDALTLKEEGNELFKTGKVVEALDKWTKGLKLDPMADRCISASPTWSKGWYRKGVALMRSKRYVEAAAAFQGGLKCSPDDADLKQCYMEATRAAEKAGGPRKTDGAFDKRMIGMLMDLRHNSFDVRAFMSKTKIRSQLEYWDLKVAPILSTTSFQEYLERAMRLPILSVHSDSQQKKSPSWANYILPDHPLLTCAVFLRLLSTAQGFTPDWHVVWCHSVPAKPFTKSSLFPHMSTHSTYAALIAKKSGEVIDLLSLWAKEVGADSNEDGTRWLDRIVSAEDEDENFGEGETAGKTKEVPTRTAKPSMTTAKSPEKPSGDDADVSHKDVEEIDEDEMDEVKLPPQEPPITTTARLWKVSQEIGIGLALIATLVFIYMYRGWWI
ncbi:hypothetical protein BC829DRAFT_444355 [Chytridium lagenaria]|nr:hypothetical protein BC829DRAFT_444355 [Chytridium lagenaria]